MCRRFAAHISAPHPRPISPHRPCPSVLIFARSSSPRARRCRLPEVLPLPGARRHPRLPPAVGARAPPFCSTHFPSPLLGASPIPAPHACRHRFRALPVAARFLSPRLCRRRRRACAAVAARRTREVLCSVRRRHALAVSACGTPLSLPPSPLDAGRTCAASTVARGVPGRTVTAAPSPFAARRRRAPSPLACHSTCISVMCPLQCMVL